MRTPPGKNHADTTGTATVPVELRPAAGLKASKRPGGQGRGRLPARAGRASEVRKQEGGRPVTRSTVTEISVDGEAVLGRLGVWLSSGTQ